MALVKCIECGHELSESATQCPNCGHKLPQKRWGIAFLLSLFLGGFGLDRAYLGYIAYALIKFFTLGLLGIWTLYDILMLGLGKMRDANGIELRGYNRGIGIFVVGIFALLFVFGFLIGLYLAFLSV